MMQARHILSGATALAALLAFGSVAMAKPAYVKSTVNLRQAPGTTSEIVGKIPAGSLIEANECTEGWCAVTWQDKAGFAIQTSIDQSGRVPQRTVVRRAPARVYYEEPPVYFAPPPPFYGRPYFGRPYYGRPYYGRRWHRW
ncbi:MAG: SH3 domain-containing protein [Pseudolabrys sp.]|nr:SH3 domain-containing protein [Pseudolabrys sp.]